MTLVKEDGPADSVSNVEICNMAYHGRLEKCKSLLRETPSLARKTDQDGRNALHWACSAGRSEVAAHLLQLQPSAIANTTLDVNAADDSGWSALHIASSAGREDIVGMLLARGDINVHVTNTTGQSPLHYAASKDWYKICEMLLERGVIANTADRHGHTALHRASSKGHTRVVTLLLRQPQVEVDAQDKEGNTPLHLSCEGDHVDICKLLVRSGADLGRRNKAEQCPCDLGSGALANTLQRARNTDTR